MTSAIGSSPIRIASRLEELTAAERELLLRRSASVDAVAGLVAGIIADVRARGDAALRELARRFDAVDLDELEVPRSALDRALERTAAPLRRAMERAARNIRAVHEAFLPRAHEVEVEPGIRVGRRPDPLGRVGVYAPGGRAAYPSSVMMGAIPARVAGVGEIILASPPEPGGAPTDAVLAAARISGVDRVFAIGGAGAVAGLAFGTRSVPRVDRIVGPGNAYVAAAKLQLVGEIGIDAPAGPSELLVIADASADPDGIAMELVAQAEHDPLACVAALVVGGEAAAVTAALEEAAVASARADVVSASLAARGAVIECGSLDDAVAFANEYAPEHLLLALERAESVLPRIRNAGTVFVGCTSSVTFGDYVTGANHVLPTAGAARSYSGLSTLDFIRWTSWQRIDPAVAAGLAEDVAVLATAEGLPGHAAAALRWRRG